MATQTDNLPEVVTLPVPRAYREFLVQKRVRSLARTVLSGVVIFAAFAVAFHWKAGSVAPHFIGLFAALLFGGKMSELRPKTWHYTLDGKQFRVLWWTGDKDKEWNWYNLRWQKDALLRVEQDEWRGLPALRLLTDNATPNLVMVYAHEDRDTVTNVVLPLIEQYRQQYRHPLWADVLRQEKP